MATTSVVRLLSFFLCFFFLFFPRIRFRRTPEKTRSVWPKSKRPKTDLVVKRKWEKAQKGLRPPESQLRRNGENQDITLVAFVIERLTQVS